MQPNMLQVIEDRTGIAHAVVVAGTQEALAARLGVTQQAVSGWLKRGWVPLRRALEIESLYGVPRGRLVNPQIADLLESPSFDAVAT